MNGLRRANMNWRSARFGIFIISNPKDINKLQLEGLVKAGAFDKIDNNRQALFNSIPSFILKSKNIFDNKAANQIDLFGSDEIKDDVIVNSIEDWKFEERYQRNLKQLVFLSLTTH